MKNNAKKSFVDVASQWFANLGGWSYDHRWLMFFLCAAVLAFSAWLASGTRFDNSFEAYFDRNDPVYQDFLQFREDFGSDEISYILYEAPDKEHGPFDLTVMEKIASITEAMEEEVPFIKEVTSLANAEFIEGIDDELVVHDLLDEFPETQEELLVIRDKVLAKPAFVGSLISADAKHAAIIVEMEKASIDPLEEIRLDPDGGDHMDNLYPQATYNVIEEILARPEYAGIKFYHTGDVPLNAQYNYTIESESGRLALISFGIIGLVLLFFFRRPLGIIGPLAVVALSILIVTGFLGLMDWQFDLMFIMLPSIVIAVGVADAVHILSEFGVFHNKLGERREAIVRTMYLVGVPCLFTSITTIAGFSSMAVSPIKSIKHFALYSAVGVGSAFLLTVTFLIVLLSFGRASKKPANKIIARAKGGQLMNRALTGIADFTIRFRWPIIAVGFVLFVVSAVGITKLKVDSNFLSEFDEEFPVRAVTEHVDSVMGGAGAISYVFNTDDPDGIMEPSVLREIEYLQDHADGQDFVVMKTNSIVDLLKELNKTMHNEDPAWYKLPETREMAAQYILLYEMSGGEELENLISGDRSRANMEARVKMVNSSEYVRFNDNLQAKLDEKTDKEIDPRLTGMGALWMKLIDYIVDSQIRGFLLAFCVIAVMMCVVFRSFKTGLLSMVPNLSPVVLTLGIMGWAGIDLDYIKLLIACVAIGIAVDDTVHLITRYRHEFLEHKNYRAALYPAMTDVGRALFITTIVLVAGFSVTTFSVMASLANFGILVSTTIVVALLADFFLLPALVIVFKPFGPEEEKIEQEKEKKTTITVVGPA